MLIECNGEIIVIPHVHALIEQLRNKSTESRKMLLKQTLSAKNAYTILFPENIALRGLLENLSESEVLLVIQHVFAEEAEFARLFDFNLTLRSTLALLSRRAAEATLEQVLRDPAKFRLLFEGIHAVKSFLLQFPGICSDDLMTRIYADSNDFSRIFNTLGTFIEFTQEFSDTYAKNLIEFIISNPTQFRRLIHTLDDFIKAIKNMPTKFANELHRYLLAHKDEFSRLIDSTNEIESFLKNLPEELTPAFIAQIHAAKGDRSLHLMARIKPELIPLLLNLGADPKKLDTDGRSPLQILLSREKFDIYHAFSLIEKGADPNSKNREGYSLLHLLARAELDPCHECIPALLNLGALPNIPDPTGTTALSSLLSRKYFSDKDIDSVLSMIQHGAYLDTTNNRQQNILEVIFNRGYGLHVLAELPKDWVEEKYLNSYMFVAGKDTHKELPKFYYVNNSGQLVHLKVDDFTKLKRALLPIVGNHAYTHLSNRQVKNLITARTGHVPHQFCPSLKKYFRSCGIPEDSLEDPVLIFKKINMAEIRLNLRYQSSVHQARNEYINFLFILSQDISSPTSNSFFKGLPPEMLFKIIDAFDFRAMEKTSREGLALARAVLSQPDTIKKLAGNKIGGVPVGGINVYQDTEEFRNEGEEPTRALRFSFFNSGTTLFTTDFRRQKNKLMKEQIRRNPIYDYFTGKKFTATSERKMREFKQQALGYLRLHSGLFRDTEQQHAFNDLASATELALVPDPKPIISKV